MRGSGLAGCARASDDVPCLRTLPYGAIVAERLVHQRGFHIHEVDEDDDAKAAKSVANEVIAKMP